MKRLVFVIGLTPALALAEPRIETIDRGDVVEVIAHDVTATNTNIAAVRSRLEIPISGQPPVIHQPSADPTIVVTELEKGNLSIKLSHDRPIVKALAPSAKAIQLGPDLHVLIPRSTEPTTIPEPTRVPKIEAPEAEPPKAEAKPVPAPVAMTPDPKPEPPPPPAPAIAKPVPAPAPTIQTATKQESPISKFSMFAALGLVAVGCGAWILKRRKTAEPSATIEVIAQRGIGAKAKVVWLAAGQREMLIAVTPQHVRMLGQWKKGEEVNLAMPRVTTVSIPTAQVVETNTKDMAAANPAVAGILKLKGRAPTRPIIPPVEQLDEDIASGDPEADTLWANEILAATKAHGLRGGR